MSDRTTDIVARIQAGIEKSEAKTAAELSRLEKACNEALRQIGRLTVGGIHSAPEAAERRLQVLNQAIAERGGNQLSYADLERYDEAVGLYFRHGQAALDRGDIRAALSVASDPSGGYLVVDDKDPVPREKLYRTSPMRALASVQPVAGGAFEGVLETGDYGAGWTGELDARTETASGTFAEFRIVAQEQYALVPVTQRLLDDAAIDVSAYVVSRLDAKFLRTENAAFVSGDGNLKPRGFLTYPTSTQADDVRPLGTLQHIPSGAPGGFPIDGTSSIQIISSLYDAKASLHSELRAGAVWAMNSATFAHLEKLRDADGHSLLNQPLGPATPERLLGYPVFIFEDMPDIAVDSLSIAFANFAVAYQIVEKPGVRVLRDPYTQKGKVQFYAYRRVGGDVVDWSAIKLIKFSES
jgi:HK97 family phage major capsid protein